MDSYVTVKNVSEFRFEDRKSIFIGNAMPVSTEAEALDFIQKIKKRYPDARHWVYAYVLRENSTARFTDDREPQGTAGMPVLDVIRKRGITDVVIVVVRYFGGILLGTGGLVRAYTEAAVGAIEEACVITYDTYVTLSLTVGYSDYQKITAALSKYDFLPDDTDYSESVTVIGTVKEENYEKLLCELREVTSGRCVAEFIDKNYAFRE